MMLCRAAVDEIASRPVTARMSLGVYACARITAEGAQNVMIAFALDGDGKIVGEQLLTSGFRRSPAERPELIDNLLDKTGARNVVAACNYGMRFIIEGCDGLIKRLAKRGAVLTEFILTDGFDCRFLIGAEKQNR